MKGSPCAAAALRAASSASGWTIDCTPTGASITGAGIARAEHGGARSRSETSRNIRGTIFQRSNACRLAAHRALRPGTPGHVAEGLRAQYLAGALLELGYADRQLGSLIDQAASIDLELEVGEHGRLDIGSTVGHEPDPTYSPATRRARNRCSCSESASSSARSYAARASAARPRRRSRSARAAWK